MVSVPELIEQAKALDVTTFEASYGPVALLSKPPSDQMARAALSVQAKTIARTRGEPLDDLLVMLRGFRTLNVFFLKPEASPQHFKLGRDGVCQVVVDDGSVSKVHATLTWSGQGWQLRDELSLNGTFVNAEVVSGDRQLKNGDVVSLGDADLVFVHTRTLRSQLLTVPPPRQKK